MIIRPNHVKIKYLKKRLIACGMLLLVVAALIKTPAIQASATSETRKKLQEAQERKKQSEAALEDKKDDIDDLNDTKSSLQGELNTLNSELTQVSENLADLESQMTAKQEDIDQTKEDLEEARNTADEQYASMKKRIQFIYEQQGQTYMDMLLNAESFGDFLNETNYIEALSAYDRKMLVQYRATRDEIEAKEQQLETEMDELTTLQAKTAAEQSRVSGLVSQTKGNIGAYSNQIASAEAEAQALEDTISQQEAEVKALQEKLAEEIRLSQLARQSTWRDISSISFADGDRYLLANLIYCEAGGEPYAGKLAVGAVVINRVRSSVYPDTVVGVIYQNKQFSPVASGRLAAALASDKATAACYQAADEAMAGATNVGECVYFRTPIEGLTGISIGGHIFY